MMERRKSWIPHLLSLTAVMVFGLMSLACFDLENLDPLEAAIFWDYPPEPVLCDALDEPFKASKSILFIASTPYEEPLEDVAIDITFSFYPSEWTGELDDSGDSICAQELEWSSSSSVFTGLYGGTNWVPSPSATWSDTKDILVISWEATKPGFTARAGSIILHSDAPELAFIKTVHLVSIDDNPN